MPTLDCFGTVVNVDEDGYLEDGEDWTPEVAETLARRAGIARMTDRHWKVIAQCREDAARGGEPLDSERIAAQPFTILFIRGEAGDVVDPVGKGRGPFLGCIIADQVRPAARNGLTPVARVLAELIGPGRIYLILDDTG